MRPNIQRAIENGDIATLQEHIKHVEHLIENLTSMYSWIGSHDILETRFATVNESMLTELLETTYAIEN